MTNAILTIGYESLLVAFVLWLAWVILLSAGEHSTDNE